MTKKPSTSGQFLVTTFTGTNASDASPFYERV